MIRRFREYFTYTKKERNGIIVLLLILVLLVIVRVYQKNIEPETMGGVDEEFRKEIDAFENSLKPKTKEPSKEEDSNNIVNLPLKETWRKPLVMFSFDPNSVTKDDLTKLGLTHKQTSTLIKYRDKGGVFYTKEDLLKIYGIEQEQYEFLKSYIEIKPKNEKEKKELVKKEIINLNDASIEDLVKISGVGETFAKRIIKYRNLLGGFYNKEQLLEVYGIDSLRFNQIKNEVSIDTLLIEKIDINSADYKTLIKHPYLNKYQTESILKYKQLVGSFTNIEQIHQNKLLIKEDYLKLRPYLKLK